MRYVLDACALLSLIKAEEGMAIVREALEAEDSICLIHAVNLCEVYYDCLRCYGNQPSEDIIANLVAAGLGVRGDMDTEFWKAAGHLKAAGRVSLADCFAVVLSVREDATLLTSDRREFEPLLTSPWFPAKIKFIR